MQPTDPRHGSYAGWHAHRKAGTPFCEPCLNARRRYQKRLDVDHDRGIRRRIPITRARAHVHALYSRGLSYKTIADRAGVAPRTIYRAAGIEPADTITRGATVAILAVPLDTPIESGYVPAHGVVRRLQALACLGHPMNLMADRIGMARSNMSILVNGARPGRPNQHVHADTHRAVAALYDELSMKLGESKRTRTIASQRGWVPPLAWDDIDDKHERPKLGRQAERHQRRKTDVDEAVVLRVLAGEVLPMTTAERFDVMARWLARGGSERALCERMNWKEGRYSQPYVVGNVSRPARRMPVDRGEAVA